MRTEKEEELLALENYWKERLAAQEAETVHRQKLTEQEVSSIISVHSTLVSGGIDLELLHSTLK